MSRDGTVTGHNEVTLKSETGSFGEHAQKYYRHRIYGKRTPGTARNTGTRSNLGWDIQECVGDKLRDRQDEPYGFHSPG